MTVQTGSVFVGKAMWIYVTVTLALIVCTVAGAYVWNLQSGKADSKRPVKGVP